MSEDEIWKINSKELPTLEEVDNKVRELLKYIYEKDYSKFVLNQGRGHYLIVTKGYLYYPPINLTIISHPNDGERALFISISRKIPISNEQEFVKLAKSVGDMFSIEFEQIERKYAKEENVFKANFASISARIHALALRDSAWFFLMLSKILKLDDIILGKVKDEGLPKDDKNVAGLDYT
ncbi:MAG: hypothetical protein ACP6IP_02645 [Candidatus Njordarchaeia archaeon]